MTWHEAVREGFPGIDPDEPQSLRQNIEDELADHLACAFAREREHAPDDAQAETAVLHRFGSPRKIARKLWLDAMKEIIMNQRILLSTTVVLAVACLGAVAFSWMAMKQSQTTNQAMLAAIEKLATNSAESGSDLASLVIRLRKGSEGGPPAAGAKLYISGKPFNDTTDESISVVADAEGMAKVGPIRPGNYRMMVVEWPSEEVESSCTELITLYGGETAEQTIVCPDVQQTTARVSLDLPEKYRRKDLIFDLKFETSDLPGVSTTWRPYQQDVLITTSGKKAVRTGGKADRREFDFSSEGPEIDVATFDYKLSDNAYVFLRRSVEGSPSYQRIGQIQMAEQEFDASSGITNSWEVEFSEHALAQLDQLLKEFGGPEEHVGATVLKSIPLTQDCMTLAYMDGWAHGNVDNIAVANNGGGVRTLVQWDASSLEGFREKDVKCILALYSRKTTVHENKGKLAAHSILAPWPELTSWTSLPRFDETPLAMFDFEPGDGWKFFDVTEAVLADAESEDPHHGVLLRFEKEDFPASEGWAGYAFVSREGEGEWLDKHPRLLVVENDSPPAEESGTIVGATSAAFEGDIEFPASIPNDETFKAPSPLMSSLGVVGVFSVSYNLEDGYSETQGKTLICRSGDEKYGVAFYKPTDTGFALLGNPIAFTSKPPGATVVDGCTAIKGQCDGKERVAYVKSGKIVVADR